jgi:RNA recognition motif-containing protein
LWQLSFYSGLSGFIVEIYLMDRKLYIANLPSSVGPKSLRQEFSVLGTVATLNIITDRKTGRSKGMAFIEMSTADEAERAIKELNGKSLGGQKIEVSIAKPHNAPASRGSGKANRGPEGHPGPGGVRDNRW